MGYIKSVMEMWDGRDVGIRSQASILSQIKCIEVGGLLSEYEKSEIEQRVEIECKGVVNEPNPAGQEEEESVDFDVHREESDEFESANELECSMVFECGNDDTKGDKGESCENNVIVEVERLDCVVVNGVAKLLSEDEEATLLRIGHFYDGTNNVEIPSLKGRDRRKVMKEVCFVNRLLHIVKIEEVNVSSVNRLIYAGSYVQSTD